MKVGSRAHSSYEEDRCVLQKVKLRQNSRRFMDTHSKKCFCDHGRNKLTEFTKARDCKVYATVRYIVATVRLVRRCVLQNQNNESRSAMFHVLEIPTHSKNIFLQYAR